MKRYVILSILCCWFAAAQAQSVGNISIGVVVPEQQDEIKSDAFRLLATRMKAIAASNGISSDLNGTFVMYPVVNITDDQLVEGGLKNFRLVELELSLFIRQLSTGAEFGTCSKALKGNGRSLTEAVRNAFAGINPKENTYANFITQAKAQITSYFTSNRTTLLEKAKSMATMQQYEEALALLMTYPQTLPGADEVNRAAITIYKSYQNSICSQLLSEARSAVAVQDYAAAASTLAQIDSESDCHEEAVRLSKQIGNEIKAQQSAEKELILKTMQQEHDLEVRRINAIKAIATSYFQHQPQITYTQIVR